jgi:hypothetical protein
MEILTLILVRPRTDERRNNERKAYGALGDSISTK